VATLSWYAGKAVADAIERYGLYAVVALIAVALVGWFVMRRIRSRLLEET
jgi:hypothetical protein